jgi:hypothetical protein
MASIGIITTNMGRVPILEIFCAGVWRLREETGLKIPCIVVGDSLGAEVCAEYDITHIEYPNKPLSGKFNRACIELKGKVDYVMLMGSDNIMSTETFLRIQAEADKGIDLIGLSEVYFYGMDDIYARKLIHFKYTKVLGVGRTVSSRVLGNVHWQPWKRSVDRGIDTAMLDGIRGFVGSSVLLDNGHVFDLKTSMNLNKIDFWAKKLGFMPNDNLIWDSIGELEADLINKYLK